MPCWRSSCRCRRAISGSASRWARCRATSAGWCCAKARALCAIGLILGVGGAAALTRWLSSELYGVSPTDPSTYVAVAATMGVVTLVACLVPAWRAMRVDPLIALRQS